MTRGVWSVGEAGEGVRLTGKQLTDLADDLADMQRHLNNQVRRMDGIVDGFEARWDGPAARTYRRLHQEAAEDAVRIREVLRLLEAGVRASKGGFTGTELAELERFRRIQQSTDVEGEAEALSRGDHRQADPAASHSRISDL